MAHKCRRVAGEEDTVNKHRIALEHEKFASTHRTEKAAIRASIAHWKRIKRYVDSTPISEDVIDLVDTRTGDVFCALCMTFSCLTCPLALAGYMCRLYTSPYSLVQDALNERLDLRESVNNMLEKLEELSK
ncbi:hypothetical protein OAF54_02935 [bacterium]|nr:hypothetical protein [bacterium]